jgi:hypothetical protein
LGGLISKLHDRDNNDHEASENAIYALIIGGYRGTPKNESGPGEPMFLQFRPTAGITKNRNFQEFRPKMGPNKPALRHPGLGQFDRNPQIDLGHDLVQLVIAGRLAQVAGHRFQPQQRGLIERTGQQAEL